ncbi:MAG: phage portal protein, partial [Turicibacter sp.]
LKGDFEGVISLIDAYNLLQSDRVNDKEQMVDALLAVVGASLGDDQDEKVETARLLKEMKIIELDEGGDAKWLVKGLNEQQTEILKKSLKDDIHEFSKVPCLTDENFVGNASGVAMKYKLLGFEQLGKTKERYFKKGLRQRLKLMANIENIRAKNIDVKTIDITMKRSLPVDDELLARIAQETDGFISWETRVQRFDSEIDIEEERKRLKEERQKSIEERQKAYGSYDFKEENEDDDNGLDRTNN